MSSGAIIPARAPASMDMLQMVSRPSIESPDRLARVLEHVPDAPVDADPADRAQDHVLGGDPERQLTAVEDPHRLRR